MNRENLINRLVARKLQSAGNAKASEAEAICVGTPLKAICVGTTLAAAKK
jgi:hypothetical protein